MNAFGASAVLVLSAMNARRQATQSVRRDYESASRCGIDEPCAERERGRIQRCAVSGRYETCRACFRD
jgi:hypothetical protein